MVCHDDTTNTIVFSGNNPGIIYNWSNNNPGIGLAANGTGNISSFTGINNTNVDITATISVIPTLGSCVGDTMFFTITIKPTPTLSAPVNQTICVGSATNAIIFNPLPQQQVVRGPLHYLELVFLV